MSASATQGGHNNIIVILTIKQKKQLWRKQAINHNLQELSSTTSNFSTQAFSTGPTVQLQAPSFLIFHEYFGASHSNELLHPTFTTLTIQYTSTLNLCQACLSLAIKTMAVNMQRSTDTQPAVGWLALHGTFNTIYVILCL